MSKYRVLLGNLPKVTYMAAVAFYENCVIRNFDLKSVIYVIICHVLW